MLNEDLIQNIKESFISGAADTFWPAVVAYVKSLPEKENPKKALKHLYHHGQSLIAYAVSQTISSDNQRFVYSRYFNALGDELIEPSDEKDYLLNASASHNNEMIKILYTQYLELLSYASEENKPLIKQRLERVESENGDLSEYFNNEKNRFTRPPLLETITIDSSSSYTPTIFTPTTASLPSSNNGQTQPPLQQISDTISEHSPNNQAIITRNILPPLPHPSSFPPPLVTKSLPGGGYTVTHEYAVTYDPDLDPLTFRRNTWIGASFGLFIALLFLCVAYTMKDDTLREGFTHMFRHMSDDFHHTHGDTAMHSNVKLSARVCFFGVLSLGTAAVSGFIGSRFKPG